MNEIESGKSAEQENYWLIQYQKLLDSKPKGVEKAEREMDPQVGWIILVGSSDRVDYHSRIHR